MSRPSAWLEALQLLARRELSAAECRARLLDRGHAADEVEQAVAQLIETGALNDGRLARAYARTALTVKGRGRLRIMRELHARGIDRDVVAEALGEVFADTDERAHVARAIQKKLRGRPRPATPAEAARLYQYLLRQGFTPAVVNDAVRKLRRGGGADET